MTFKGMTIEERDFNGHKYYVLCVITDDKENPKKDLGVIKKHTIKPFKTKEFNNK